MIRRFTTIVAMTLLIAGCADDRSYARAVYMLIDTSGTYTAELDKANQIINYLLARLDPGDSLAVARIDSASFSEKDIVAKAEFDARPSRANAQKRSFREEIDAFVESVKKGSSHTDITGGVLQAVEWLNETGAGNKTILVFSDLKEDLPEGHVREFAIELSGVEVVAINVTKLRADNIDPRQYLERLDQWQARIQNGGGEWRVVNDLERLEGILQD